MWKPPRITTSRLALAALAALLAAAGCGGTATTGSISARSKATALTATRTAAPDPSSTQRPSARSMQPLDGVRVGIDPGHNGGNASAAPYINHLVWNGREQEACDTTGTQTDQGYPESRFTFAVATALRRNLQSLGAVVVMTHRNDHGVGPCVNARARILDRAHVDVAVDIHADGGPATGRGFTVLEPVADGPNDTVIGASRRFGDDVLGAFRRLTPMPVSTYDGIDGVAYRDDLAGLNLTTVPKVLVECGNMRNPTDAGLLTSPRFQRQVATAFVRAIREFLHH